MMAEYCASDNLWTQPNMLRISLFMPEDKLSAVDNIADFGKNSVNV